MPMVSTEKENAATDMIPRYKKPATIKSIMGCPLWFDKAHLLGSGTARMLPERTPARIILTDLILLSFLCHPPAFVRKRRSAAVKLRAPAAKCDPCNFIMIGDGPGAADCHTVRYPPTWTGLDTEYRSEWEYNRCVRRIFPLNMGAVPGFRCRTPETSAV